MTTSKLKNMLKNNNRYKEFKILDVPTPFDQIMADQDIDIVQTHSIQTIETDGYTDIVGFCGQFTWKNNELTPLDGDTYNSKVLVYGYEWWENRENGIKCGLDILVGDDW